MGSIPPYFVGWLLVYWTLISYKTPCSFLIISFWETPHIPGHFRSLHPLFLYLLDCIVLQPREQYWPYHCSVKFLPQHHSGTYLSQGRAYCTYLPSLRPNFLNCMDNNRIIVSTTVDHHLYMPTKKCFPTRRPIANMWSPFPICWRAAVQLFQFVSYQVVGVWNGSEVSYCG